MAGKRFQRYTSSEVHWRLIEMTEDDDTDQEHVSESCTCRQALFCPYYATLEGTLGSDWGVIVNPESYRFGLMTFEHHACGCPVDDEGHTAHGGGQQRVDEWCVPSCRATHSFRNGDWASCWRPKGHRGIHRDRRRTWR